MTRRIITTTVVGSYPQPDWLVDRALLAKGVPRVVGRIRRTRPVELRDMQFLRRNTGHRAKITLPGPFTMAQQAQNDFYGDVDEMAMDFAAAVNAEARDLEAAGADVRTARTGRGARRR